MTWLALSSNCMASACADADVDVDAVACGIWRVNKRAANADAATLEPGFKSRRTPATHPRPPSGSRAVPFIIFRLVTRVPRAAQIDRFCCCFYHFYTDFQIETS